MALLSSCLVGVSGFFDINSALIGFMGACKTGPCLRGGLTSLRRIRDIMNDVNSVVCNENIQFKGFFAKLLNQASKNR